MSAPRWWGATLALGAVVLAALTVFLLLKVSTAASELDSLRAQQVSQDKVVGDLSTGLSMAESQLRQHGIEPVPPPPQTIIEQGATGPQGPGPSDAQVATAVAAYLLAHPAPAGPPPSVGVVSAAVAQYLQANPPAAGKDGVPGAGPSDAQVAAAVAAYMSQHPAPAGPAGPQGVAGPAGPAGPAGEEGPAGAPGPACPSGYVLTQESVNGHQALVCEAQPSPSPSASSSSSSSSAPGTSAAGAGLLLVLASPGWPRSRPEWLGALGL